LSSSLLLPAAALPPLLPLPIRARCSSISEFARRGAESTVCCRWVVSPSEKKKREREERAFSLSSML
jgi:hypothetical protein